MANKKNFTIVEYSTSKRNSNYIKFDKISKFICQCNNDRGINTLIKSLKDCEKINSDSKRDSWKYSLKDFAELLADRKEYHTNMCDKLKEMNESIPARLKVYDEWQQFLTNGEYSFIHNLLSNEITNRIKKSIKSIERTEKKIVPDIYDKKLNDNTQILLEVPLEPVQYFMAKKKKQFVCPDIIMISADKKKFAIIELKQWTESFISDNVDSPNQQVEDYIHSLRESKLYKSFKEDATIRGYIYLHNQLTTNGVLYYNHIYNYEDDFNLFPYLYSKHKCLNFYNSLYNYMEN